MVQHRPTTILTIRSGTTHIRPTRTRSIQGQTLRNPHPQPNRHTITRICVTNKDRLTRFGFHYLDAFFSHLGVRVEVLDSDDTKEPHEVLMQDFMSLLASFSGKFYRLRGWEQRKRFLRDVEREVDTRAEQ